MKLTNALTFGLLALLATTAFVGPAAADTAGAVDDGSSAVTAPEYDTSGEHDGDGQGQELGSSVDAESSDDLVGDHDDDHEDIDAAPEFGP